MYALMFLVLATIFGGLYSITTFRSISSTAGISAQGEADTLASTLAEAVLLENNAGLRGRAEAARAAVHAIGDRDEALRFLRATMRGSDGYLYLMDSTGTVVVHPDPGLIGVRPNAPFVERILSAERGFVRYVWRNAWETVASNKSAYVEYYEPYEWYLVATSYTDGALSHIPRPILQTLLESYQSGSVRAVAIRLVDPARGAEDKRAVLAASSAWNLYGRSLEKTDAWRSGLLTALRHDGTESIPANETVSPPSGLVPRVHYLASAPLPGLDAEVAIVYEAYALASLYRSVMQVFIFSGAVALILMASVARLAAAMVTRPIRNMARHLERRLQTENHRQDRSAESLPETAGREVSPPRRLKAPAGLRSLILAQLRTLVRLDYERSGRQAAEQRLLISESVFRNTSEGICVTNADGSILRVNPAFERITGYRYDEVVGQNSRILKSSRHDPDFYDEMWNQLITNGSWVGEIWNRRKNGEEYPELLSIRAVSDDDEPGVGNTPVNSYVAVFHDISDIKATQDRLHHLATHDPLTGLPNRTYLTDMLSYTLRQADRDTEETAVLFLDIDNFKDVNDSFGHQAGDSMLSWIARCVEEQLRGEDIVARFGGDEFVVVLPRVPSVEAVTEIARRVLRAARRPFLVEGATLHPSISVGIAVGRTETPESMLSNADAAMYAAKQAGKNRYLFHDPAMNESAQRRIAMEGHVIRGLEAGELVAHYQPVLHVESGAIVGAEALVRWEHDGRIVPPGDFLPYIEYSEAITTVDCWILDQACRDLLSVDREIDDTFFVTVNAGAYSVGRTDYAGRVRGILEHHNVPPHRVRIEVTESAAIRNFARARQTLEELREAGLHIYLDDFGAGNASIRYLREFGVDAVKLDRSYLMEIERSPEARSLVAGFVQLIHGLGHKAVVEGVETAAQLEFLREIRCELAQGYFIGKPSPSLIHTASTR